MYTQREFFRCMSSHRFTVQARKSHVFPAGSLRESCIIRAYEACRLGKTSGDTHSPRPYKRGSIIIHTRENGLLPFWSTCWWARDVARRCIGLHVGIISSRCRCSSSGSRCMSRRAPLSANKSLSLAACARRSFSPYKLFIRGGTSPSHTRCSREFALVCLPCLSPSLSFSRALRCAVVMKLALRARAHKGIP